MLIPIKEQAVLTDDLKHPISIELLSNTLKSTRIFQSLNVNFESDEGEGMNVFLPADAQRKMHIKMKREFQAFQTMMMVVYSAPKDEWMIHVFALPAAYQEMANTFLMEDGLDVVIEWMELPITEKFKSGHQMFFLGINDSYTEYCFFEIHNTDLLYWKKQKIKSI